MLIRAEIGMDATGIDVLLRRTFPSGQEAQVVRELREEGLLTLGMVACDDEGKILGYMAFSPLTLDGEDRQWVALAPVAIDAASADDTTARQMLYEGLSTLNEFGYAAVVVMGDSAYYASLGFEPAAQHQLRCQTPGAEAALQVYALDGKVVDQQGAMIAFAAPFNRRVS